MRRPTATPDEEESEHLLAASSREPQPGGAAGVSANVATPATTQQNEQKPQGHSVVVIPTLANGQASGDVGARRGSDAGSSAGSTSQKGKDADVGQCRICLEEDALSNLEVPCACAGTSKYAHHECIQRWINEKGNLQCEICDQSYRGTYTVPPPGTAGQDLEHGNMFSPLFAIRLDPHDPRLDGGAHDRAPLDFLDETDHYYQRNPLASWCFTFVIFIMFLVVLHHTMIVADGMDASNMAGGSSGSGSDMGPGGSSGGPGSGSGSSGAEADDYATSLSLFLFWIGTKAFLIGIPLYTVMRIAARQARREQYEAMLRSAGAFDVPTRRVLWRVQLREQELREREREPAGAGAAGGAAGPAGAGGGAAGAAGGAAGVPAGVV